MSRTRIQNGEHEDHARVARLTEDRGVRHALIRGVTRVFAIAVLLLPLSIGVTAWLGAQRHADASADALAALRSDAQVLIEQGPFLTLTPRSMSRSIGVIFYPGAYADIRGYVPVMREIAAAGYRVVIVPMPLEMAIFGIDRGVEVMRRYPEIARWVLIGHSVGGAMTGPFAHRHPEQLAGVIIYDSYPAGSLADYDKPVWHIHRATLDGAPTPAFEAQRHRFPADSRWVPIRGGIHMYFGSFSGGGYNEDWAPSITREAQHRQVVAATLEALEAMSTG